MWRTGLLQTLSIRYATFYFTEFMIVMDLLPYDSKQIYSYMLPRTAGRKPVEDFCELSNILGNLWWNEKNRTKKRYLASKEVLDRAGGGPAPLESLDGTSWRSERPEQNRRKAWKALLEPAERQEGLHDGGRWWL